MIWLVLGLSIGFITALAGWINATLQLVERKHDSAFWRQRAHASETHCAAIVREHLENIADAEASGSARATLMLQESASKK
jgi:hypothetical protein